MRKPSTWNDERGARRRRYMVSDDLRFLAGVLEESAAELEAAGVIDRRDDRYHKVRLELAAVILGGARGGESDADALRRSAVRAVACSGPRRGGADGAAARRAAAEG